MKFGLLPVFIATFFNCNAQQFYKQSGFSCSDFNLVASADKGFFDAMHRIIGGLSRASLLKTDSAGTYEWHREYYGPDIVAPADARMMYDKGFVTACNLRYTGGTYKALLIKVKANGDTSWMRAYEEPGSNVTVTNMEMLPDKNMVFFGQKTNPGRLFILKTDENGNMIWEHNFYDPIPGNTKCDAIVTSDGGFAITGGRWGIIKTDSLANMQWVLPFEFDTFYNTFRNIVELSNQTLLLTGKDAVGPSSSYELFCIGTDLSGNILSSKVLPAYDVFYLREVISTADAGCILTGHIPVAGNNSAPAIFKLDSALNLNWAWKYPMVNTTSQNGSFTSVVALTDTGYVLSGNSYDGFVTLPWHILVTIDESGYTCNHQAIPPSVPQPFVPTYHSNIFADTTGSLQATVPAGIIVGVHTPSFNDVCLTTGVAPPHDFLEESTVYASEYNIWKIKLHARKAIANLSIYDVRGRSVFRKKVMDGEQISSSSFSSGLYFYLLTESERVASGKLVR